MAGKFISPFTASEPLADQQLGSELNNLPFLLPDSSLFDDSLEDELNPKALLEAKLPTESAAIEPDTQQHAAAGTNLNDSLECEDSDETQLPDDLVAPTFSKVEPEIAPVSLQESKVHDSLTDGNMDEETQLPSGVELEEHMSSSEETGCAVTDPSSQRNEEMQASSTVVETTECDLTGPTKTANQTVTSDDSTPHEPNEDQSTNPPRNHDNAKSTLESNNKKVLKSSAKVKPSFGKKKSGFVAPKTNSTKIPKTTQDGNSSSSSNKENILYGDTVEDASPKVSTVRSSGENVAENSDENKLKDGQQKKITKAEREAKKQEREQLKKEKAFKKLELEKEKEKKKEEKKRQQEEKHLEQEKKKAEKEEKQLEQEKRKAEKEEKRLEVEKKKVERERDREHKRLEQEKKKAEREQKKIEKELKKLDTEKKKQIKRKSKPLSQSTESETEASSTDNGKECKATSGDTNECIEATSHDNGLSVSGSKESDDGEKLPIPAFDTDSAVNENTEVERVEPVGLVNKDTVENEDCDLTITSCSDKTDGKTTTPAENTSCTSQTKPNVDGKDSLIKLGASKKGKAQAQVTKKFSPPKQLKTKNGKATSKQKSKDSSSKVKKSDTDAEKKSVKNKKKQTDSTSSKKRKLSSLTESDSEDSQPQTKRSKPTNYSGPVWVQCEKSDCGKWRQLRDCTDPTTVPDNWECSMNTDTNYNSCAAPEEHWSDIGDSQEFVETQFIPGSIVWAKMDGYPWWPAMIEEDPDDETYYEMGPSDSLIPVKYHVVFFDTTVCRAWVSSSHVLSFMDQLSDPNKNINVVQKLRRGLKEGTRQAKKAINMSTEERFSQFGFASRFQRNRKRKRPSDDDTEVSKRWSTRCKPGSRKSARLLESHREDSDNGEKKGKCALKSDTKHTIGCSTSGTITQEVEE